MQSNSVSTFAAATRGIHGATAAPKGSASPVISPICQSTTFARGSLDTPIEHSYGRDSNPGVAELESRFASIEGRGEGQALAFGTGMGAISALFLSVAKAGDEILVGEVVYGGTRRLLQSFLEPLGIRHRVFDARDPQALSRIIGARTRLILVETPANPTLELCDITAIAAVARSHEIPLALDNTFLTPVLLDGFALGADILCYSTTKFVEGHNATLGGMIVAKDQDLIEKLRVTRKSFGLGQKPFEAWLTLQGLKTLPFRMQRHSESAETIAHFLQDRPEVLAVRYPFLRGSDDEALARAQQGSGGGVLAFELAGGRAAVERFVEALSIVTLAENLGATESLLTHPASMTHADLQPEERARIGIREGLLRLSIGLEDPADLILELETALIAAGPGAAPSNHRPQNERTTPLPSEGSASKEVTTRD